MKTNGSSNPSQGGYELSTPITDSVIIDNIKDTQKLITGLIPGSYYQVKVTAVNQEGSGTAGVKIFKMKEGRCLYCGSVVLCSEAFLFFIISNKLWGIIVG